MNDATSIGKGCEEKLLCCAEACDCCKLPSCLLNNTAMMLAVATSTSAKELNSGATKRIEQNALKI
jgi:hypothetical protein